MLGIPSGENAKAVGRHSPHPKKILYKILARHLVALKVHPDPEPNVNVHVWEQVAS